MLENEKFFINKEIKVKRSFWNGNNWCKKNIAVCVWNVEITKLQKKSAISEIAFNNKSNNESHNNNNNKQVRSGQLIKKGVLFVASNVCVCVNFAWNVNKIDKV